MSLPTVCWGGASELADPTRSTIRSRLEIKYGVAAFRLALFALKRFQNSLDAIDGGKNERDSFTRGRHAIAKFAHQCLGSVSERLQAGQAKKSASAFDGVDEAKNIVENVGVVGILFETDKLDVDHVETFVGLGDKFPQQVVHKNAFVDRLRPVHRFPSEARPVCR